MRILFYHLCLPTQNMNGTDHQKYSIRSIISYVHNLSGSIQVASEENAAKQQCHEADFESLSLEVQGASWLIWVRR